MCVGACDAGAKRGLAGTDGSSGPDDQRALGGNFGQLGPRAADRFLVGNQKSVLSREAQSRRTPDVGINNGYARPGRRKNHSNMLLTH